MNTRYYFVNNIILYVKNGSSVCERAREDDKVTTRRVILTGVYIMCVFVCVRQVWDGGNVTESKVVLTPRPGDHGVPLLCKAFSPPLPGTVLHHQLSLAVHCEYYQPRHTLPLSIPSVSLCPFHLYFIYFPCAHVFFFFFIRRSIMEPKPF